jgi:hypothetical protein
VSVSHLGNFCNKPLSPNNAEESLLTYTEFQSVKNELIETEVWQEKIGGTVFGGSCWRLKS